MTAIADLLSRADRERLAARVRELDELGELMRQPSGLPSVPEPVRCTARAETRPGRERPR